MDRFLNTETDPNLLSPLDLAFLGDCVYELFVREKLVTEANRPSRDLHAARISPKGIACLSKRQSPALPEAMDRSISNCWTRRRTFFLSSRKFCPKGLMMTPNRLSAARLELRML